ncbi:MAG: M23 family metallopeptidase [Paracoccaceae bacterium]
MTLRSPILRALGLTTALAAMTACTKPDLDWDLRKGGVLNTADAAQGATANRPNADARGILSYPGYQVALAQRGDTVASVASRVGLDANELAGYNALKPDTALRAGEVLALPRRVSEASGTVAGPGAITGGAIQTQGIDVTTIASGAIDRAAGGAAPVAAKPVAKSAGAEPVRHKVERGETAFTIARSYNVSARALADWNGLGPDMDVREGQFLMIPVTLPGQSAQAASGVTSPGQGTPTPVPPSAAKPLPDVNEPPAATAKAAGTPVSPDLGDTRTAASAAQFAMPVDGKIIRGYVKKKNDGIDIAAAAGTAVRAAADGTVAAITKDTDQVPILVIKHAGGLLTVYAGIDAIAVAKGATVKRGQTIAKIRAADPAFLHFEVRKGFDSVDPAPYLQ